LRGPGVAGRDAFPLIRTSTERTNTRSQRVFRGERPVRVFAAGLPATGVNAVATDNHLNGC
jgi:hypothetical protein